MSERAIFQATFSDLRIVKGRKVGQFVLEVPLEGVDAALKALGGVPRPDKEVWVAVARLDPSAVQKPPEKPEAPNKREIVQLAGIVSESKPFAIFMREEKGFAEFNEMPQAIRYYCGVKSRKELATNPEAAAKFMELYTEFQVWSQQ